MARGRQLGSAVAVVSLVAAGFSVAALPQAAASGWDRCVNGPADRQATFARAADVSGVSERVLLAVSYMESRWDDHGARPSTSGGYGPMHLTLHQLGAQDPKAADKGEPAGAAPAQISGTLAEAAELTGLSTSALRTDDVTNICGGAAGLASYAPDLTQRSSAAQPLDAWSAAVARYSAATDEGTALRFTRQVFTVLRHGEARTSNDGQRVVLPATPTAKVDAAAVRSLDLTDPHNDAVDCPDSLACQSVPAPYEWYGEPNPYAYGNHDLADRPNDMAIDYIVIHDTEGEWDHVLDLVQDPTYLAWNYSIRSADGLVAQHLNSKNVGWQAGNWYVNMHSIGIEHEGFAADASWFTESMYQSSAALVGHLAQEYGVPLDRAHIIGHDQVPGIDPGHVRGMHWDPGPYWDWEHYMALLGAPIAGSAAASDAAPGAAREAAPDAAPRAGDLVTVAPGFDENVQPVTGCEDDGSCAEQGTNFVYLRTAPRFDAPLVKDEGLHPDGSHSTTEVSDIGARATAGQELAVSKRVGDWLRVWWLGRVAWLYSPADDPTVVPAAGDVVTAADDDEVPVYGRAYPEASAYPQEIPVQSVVPLQYSIKPGQAYVLADDGIATDYYYAKTFDDSLPGDHTVVVGQDRYYEVWFGHRVAYVRAADVTVTPR